MKRVKALKPVGHRVLIKIDETMDKTASGIILHSDTKRQEQQAQVLGTIMDIGQGCWKDYDDGTPWAKIGDRVMYARFHGMKIWDPVDAKYREDMLLLNDIDITAIVTEEEDINV